MPQTIELDVSHYHDEGREPFGDIMDAAGRLAVGDALVLRNSFEPVPLYGVMTANGFGHVTQQESPERWVITFTRQSIPAEQP